MSTRAIWPDLTVLPGVAEGVEAARDAIAAVATLRANRRGWPRSAAAAGIRAARASAALDGGSAEIDADAGQVTDPVLAGAIRCSAAVAALAPVFGRAPLQALARLHTLAAADLGAVLGADLGAGAIDLGTPGAGALGSVPFGSVPIPTERVDVGAGTGRTGFTDRSALGRPRADPAVAARLAGLAELVTGSGWPAPVLVGVVHAELWTVAPFTSANGVVARAAARLVMVHSALDGHALTVPEVRLLRRRSEYEAAMAGYATGTSEGVAGWLRFQCDALVAGAAEARSIADAAG